MTRASLHKVIDKREHICERYKYFSMILGYVNTSTHSRQYFLGTIARLCWRRRKYPHSHRRARTHSGSVGRASTVTSSRRESDVGADEHRDEERGGCHRVYGRGLDGLEGPAVPHEVEDRAGVPPPVVLRFGALGAQYAPHDEGCARIAKTLVRPGLSRRE